MMITIKEHNYLCKMFGERMKNQATKEGSKRFLTMQTEFFAGAIAALDAARGVDGKSEISPAIFFTIMRGDVVKPMEENGKENETALENLQTFKKVDDDNFTTETQQP